MTVELFLVIVVEMRWELCVELHKTQFKSWLMEICNELCIPSKLSFFYLFGNSILTSRVLSSEQGSSRSSSLCRKRDIIDTQEKEDWDKTEPWGTPALIRYWVEVWLFMTSKICRLVIQIWSKAMDMSKHKIYDLLWNVFSGIHTACLACITPEILEVSKYVRKDFLCHRRVGSWPKIKRIKTLQTIILSTLINQSRNTQKVHHLK